MRMTPEELSASWEGVGQSPTASPPDYSMYSPLADSADSYIRWAQSPQDRVYLGINRIDAEMRGIAPGEIAIMFGYAHSAKTLVLLHALSKNRTKRICLFIPDEPKTLVLTKLTCIHNNIDARELEKRVASDDETAIALLRDTANEGFPHLAVFDQSLDVPGMERAYGEVCDVWGQVPDLVVVDFLDLLNAGETVSDKATFLKGFGRKYDIPMLVLHQTSRTSGADGRKLTISSGSYGGEQQATSVIGVRRKKYEIQALITELTEKLDRSPSSRVSEKIQELHYLAELHQQTVTVSLLKNKRPAGQLVDDIDFMLDPHTGRLTDLRSDLPRNYPQMGMTYESIYE